MVDTDKDTSITEEQAAFLRTWAESNGCTLELDGEIGFGRECVGILRDHHYIGFTHIAMDYKNPVSSALYQEITENAPVNAYHKDSYLAVLKNGEADPLLGLYNWVADLAAKGFRVHEVEELDLGLGTTTISMLLTGRRAVVGELYKPVSS